MRDLIKLYLMVVSVGLFSCREMDDMNVDLGLDYQPLETGMFWEYEVDETIVFGENDSEEFVYFFRDVIDYSYINEAGEEVYVVMREKSPDRVEWLIEGNFSLLIRNKTLVRMQENEIVVTFVICHDLRSCKMAKLLTLLLKIIKQQKLNFVNLKIA